jgi:hypothetical protein
VLGSTESVIAEHNKKPCAYSDLVQWSSGWVTCTLGGSERQYVKLIENMYFTINIYVTYFGCGLLTV